MFNFLFRVILFCVGLVLAASLAVAVLFLAALWLMSAAWARLTGKPVTPWVMRFKPGSGFDRFRQAAKPAQPNAADVVNARARGESAEQPVRIRGTPSDVTDVMPKTPSPPER
jgi:hypothetical protein